MTLLHIKIVHHKYESNVLIADQRNKRPVSRNVNAKLEMKITETKPKNKNKKCTTKMNIIQYQKRGKKMMKNEYMMSAKRKYNDNQINWCMRDTKNKNVATTTKYACESRKKNAFSMGKMLDMEYRSWFIDCYDQYHFMKMLVCRRLQ